MTPRWRSTAATWRRCRCSFGAGRGARLGGMPWLVDNHHHFRGSMLAQVLVTAVTTSHPQLNCLPATPCLPFPARPGHPRRAGGQGECSGRGQPGTGGRRLGTRVLLRSGGSGGRPVGGWAVARQLGKRSCGAVREWLRLAADGWPSLLPTSLAPSPSSTSCPVPATTASPQLEQLRRQKAATERNSGGSGQRDGERLLLSFLCLAGTTAVQDGERCGSVAFVVLPRCCCVFGS